MVSGETLNRRVLLRISVVIMAPILALLLIELAMHIYGVLELDIFLRGLRWVSYEQGSFICKLVILAAIGIVLLVVVGLMTYGITSVLKIFGQEPAGVRVGDKFAVVSWEKQGVAG